MNALDIGINRLTVVVEMAKVIRYTTNKEDALHVLKMMDKELKEGIAEIDKIGV